MELDFGSDGWWENNGSGRRGEVGEEVEADVKCVITNLISTPTLDFDLNVLPLL